MKDANEVYDDDDMVNMGMLYRSMRRDELIIHLECIQNSLNETPIPLKSNVLLLPTYEKRNLPYPKLRARLATLLLVLSTKILKFVEKYLE